MRETRFEVNGRGCVFKVSTSFSFLSFSVTDETKVGKVMYWKSTEKISSDERFRQRASLSS